MFCRLYAEDSWCSLPDVGMRNVLRAYGPANTRPKDEVEAADPNWKGERRGWKGGFKYFVAKIWIL